MVKETKFYGEWASKRDMWGVKLVTDTVEVEFNLSNHFLLRTVKPALYSDITSIQRPPLFKDHLVLSQNL
jgi:hypothetical protein